MASLKFEHENSRKHNALAAKRGGDFQNSARKRKNRAVARRWDKKRGLARMLQHQKKPATIQDVVVTDTRKTLTFRPHLAFSVNRARQTRCALEARMYFQNTAADAAAAFSKWSGLKLIEDENGERVSDFSSSSCHSNGYGRRRTEL